MIVNLNPQQKLAVQAADKPLLIVAGAGTGKTRTLTSRLLYLINKGVPPQNIVAITFTNKAAREMAERIHNAKTANTLGEYRENFSHHSHPLSHRSHYASPFIGTFHSLGAKILRAEARRLGRTPDFVIFDDNDSLRLVKKIVKLTEEQLTGVEEQGPAPLAEKISKIKNGIVAPNSFKNSGPTLRVLKRYEEELQRQNAFDFDDLIEKVVEIFQKHPEVLKKYQKRFHCFLVDEYQDLNNKQYELVKLLVGDSSRLSVVGDDQQMIYSFRGSNFKIFLDFENDWPEANVIFLEENYRSTSNIIKTASTLVQNNVYQKPKILWTKNETGQLVKIIETDDEGAEAEWLAGQVDKFISHANAQVGKLDNQNLKTHKLRGPETIAVLYRTNAQSRALEQALLERNLPYQIFGGVRFYERKEIKDIVASLRWAQNPQDELSRERLEKNLSKRKFLEFQKSFTARQRLRPSELIHLFLETTGYLELLERDFFNFEERRENIGELMNFAAGFEELPLFLEQIALLQPTDDLAANGKARSAKRNRLFAPSDSRLAVNLMTIHLAKGLEFDTVFVAGCNEGVLPHGRSLNSQAEIEEERRLMYVAMTRAKKKLFLSFYDWPSRFLGELPQETIEFESLLGEERYIALD